MDRPSVRERAERVRRRPTRAWPPAERSTTPPTPATPTTHTRPLQVLVTNDDGYNAPGIDAAVQALRTVPGVQVTVVAPATNQSGAGDKTTPGGVTAFAALTLSGYPATAVNGYPADSVNYALHVMGLNPDLVVSGINFGQNLAVAVALSGTIGAARVGARNGIPALAASQGFGTHRRTSRAAPAAVLAWLNDFRLGRAGPPYQTVANLNIPTCTSGSIRGTVVLPAVDRAQRSSLRPVQLQLDGHHASATTSMGS